MQHQGRCHSIVLMQTWVIQTRVIQNTSCRGSSSDICHASVCIILQTQVMQTGQARSYANPVPHATLRAAAPGKQPACSSCCKHQPNRALVAGIGPHCCRLCRSQYNTANSIQCIDYSMLWTQDMCSKKHGRL